MLHFVQHDKCGVVPHALFVIPNVSEESGAWMLRSAQHDKSENVIPSESEESSVWRLVVPRLLQGEGRFGNAETG